MADGNVAIFTAPRDATGKFLKGGPGRSKGALAKHSRTLLAQVKAMGDTAVEGLWTALQANERWAIEMVLSHVLPRDRALEWNGVEPDDIREAICEGDLGIDEAARLATALVRLNDATSLDDLRKRIDDMEAAIGDYRRG